MGNRHRNSMGKVQDIITENAGKVVVFGAGYCPYCQKARQVLEGSGLPVHFVWDGELTPEIKEDLRSIVGKTSVPQGFVGDTHLGGCNDGGAGGIVPLTTSGQLAEMLK